MSKDGDGVEGSRECLGTEINTVGWTSYGPATSRLTEINTVGWISYSKYQLSVTFHF